MLKQKRSKSPKKLRFGVAIPIFDGPVITDPLDDGPALPSGTTDVDVSGYVTFLCGPNDVHLDATILNPNSGQGPATVVQPTVDSSGIFWRGGHVGNLQDGNRVVIIASVPSEPLATEYCCYIRIANGPFYLKRRKNGKKNARKNGRRNGKKV